MARFVLLLAFVFSFNTSLFAQDQLKDIYKNYLSGKYQEVLKDLSHFYPQDKNLVATKTYWEGLCYSRLTRYNEAVSKFDQARREGSTALDLDYEQGQAYYALNELEKSRKSFELSAKKNFKRATSYYYMAHVSQLLEEYPVAKSRYEKILKEQGVETSLLQFSRFQLGEVLLSIAEQKEEKKETKEDISTLVGKHVLPQMEKAFNLAPTSPTANDIKKRMDEIKKQFGLDPNFLRNGRQITPKAWELSLSQKFTYDNNITQATDLPTVRATQKDSYIFDTEAFGKYRFIFDRQVVLNPELRLIRTKYGDQKTSEVYTNDSYSIAPALRTKYEHKLFNEMASTLFDLEYNYTARDRLSKHDYIFYGRSFSESLGEKFKFFSFGETTIKLKVKQYYAYDLPLNSKSLVPSLSQVIFLPSIQHLLLLYFQSDFTKVTDDTQNAVNHLLRFDYIIPEFTSSLWTLQGSFSLLWTDPEVGKETRGVEKTYSPGIKLTRNISPDFQASLSYDYSQKTSLDKGAYAYSKNTTAFEIRYSF